MKNREKIIGKVRYVFTLLCLCAILYFTYQIYQKNNFDKFVKCESNLYTSEFIRDSDIKFSNKRSYKISSEEYNDAMFYKTVKLEKNQPYKVSCMIRTENITSKENKSGIGAQISIEGSTERSIAITGTSDWKKIELIFNSKDREEVNIGFRLGGYLGNAKGSAWFSDFKLEEGTDSSNNNEWNFACFIFKTTDVTIGDKQSKLNVTNSDIKDIKDTLQRFSSACNTLSKGKMTAKYTIYEIEEPLTKLSYDDKFAYYVSPEDVEAQIKDIISNNEYDHIFAVIRLRRR